MSLCGTRARRFSGGKLPENSSAPTSDEVNAFVVHPFDHLIVPAESRLADLPSFPVTGSVSFLNRPAAWVRLITRPAP